MKRFGPHHFDPDLFLRTRADGAAFRGLWPVVIFWALTPLVVVGASTGFGVCPAATLSALGRLPPAFAEKILGPVFVVCSAACLLSGYGTWFVDLRADRSPRRQRTKVVCACLAVEAATVLLLVIVGAVKR